MARRHLYFEVDEWRAMPWWKTRLYEEGLVQEFARRDDQPGEFTDSKMVAPESVGIRWASG